MSMSAISTTPSMASPKPLPASFPLDSKPPRTADARALVSRARARADGELSHAHNSLHARSIRSALEQSPSPAPETPVGSYGMMTGGGGYLPSDEWL